VLLRSKQRANGPLAEHWTDDAVGSSARSSAGRKARNLIKSLHPGLRRIPPRGGADQRRAVELHQRGPRGGRKRQGGAQLLPDSGGHAAWLPGRPLAEIEDDLRRRDERDSNRKEAPLVPASDAFILDTSAMDREAAIAAAIEVVNQAFEKMQDEFLKSKDKMIRGISSLDAVLKYFPNQKTDYSVRRIKKGIRARFIYTSSQGDIFSRSDKKGLWETKYIDLSKLKFDADISIVDDFIAISSLKGKLSGTIITHKDLANSFKNLYDFLWRLL